MKNEKRFKGKMSEEYRLINLALPHFEELQEQVGEAVAAFQKDPRLPALRVIDIGCGDGVTSFTILRSRRDVYLVCLDNEEEMVRQARIPLLAWGCGERLNCLDIRTDIREGQATWYGHAVTVVRRGRDGSGIGKRADRRIL